MGLSSTAFIPLGYVMASSRLREGQLQNKLLTCTNAFQNGISADPHHFTPLFPPTHTHTTTQLWAAIKDGQPFETIFPQTIESSKDTHISSVWKAC